MYNEVLKFYFNEFINSREKIPKIRFIFLHVKMINLVIVMRIFIRLHKRKIFENIDIFSLDNGEYIL